MKKMYCVNCGEELEVTEQGVYNCGFCHSRITAFVERGEADPTEIAVDEHNQALKILLLIGGVLLMGICSWLGTKNLQTQENRTVLSFTVSALAYLVACMPCLDMAYQYLKMKEGGKVLLAVSRVITAAAIFFWSKEIVRSFWLANYDMQDRLMMACCLLGNVLAFVMPFFKRQYKR